MEYSHHSLTQDYTALSLGEPKEKTSGLRKIGYETTEELEYVPPELYVKKYIRAKYAKLESEGIVIAAPPKRPIDKGTVPQSKMDHLRCIANNSSFTDRKLRLQRARVVVGSKHAAKRCCHYMRSIAHSCNKLLI